MRIKIINWNVDENFDKKVLKELPKELRISEIVETFIVTILYWFNTDCKETPETLTTYFFAMNR